MEGLLTRLALRFTDAPAPDVPIPKDGTLNKGWLFAGERTCDPRVEHACSSAIYHGFGRDDKTTTQGAASLYSTKLRCLRALRAAVELDCAQRLRAIDQLIATEAAIEALTETGAPKGAP